MTIKQMLAAAVFGAVVLAGCQEQPAPTSEAPVAGEPAQEASTEPQAPALPCGILAERNWRAQVSAGSPSTVTVSGEIDLGTPGFGVSLARDPTEAPGATAATLSLQLRPPSGVVPQVVTPHPVYYFAPAGGAYTSVQIVCDGAPVTTIAVTP